MARHVEQYPMSNYYELICPFVLILFSLGSAVGYAVKGQWWAVLYWTCAALINFAFTMGMRK